MFGLFKKKPGEDAALVRRAFDPQVVVVLSASCCMPGTGDVDAEVEANARAALTEAALDWPVLTLTVTQAQSALTQLSSELDATQAALARQVTELFMTTGLSAFPALIVSQRLVAYGGVPGKDLIRGALPAGGATQPAPAHEGTA